MEFGSSLIKIHLRIEILDFWEEGQGVVATKPSDVGSRSRRSGSNGSMPFIDHVRELRRSLIISLLSIFIAAVVAFIFYDHIISLLFRPFRLVYMEPGAEVLYVNTLLEGFLTKLKVVLLTGLLVSLPVHVYNLVRFVFPGLTKRERKIMSVVLVSSFFLIAGSAYYGFFKIIPLSIRFLTTAGFIPERVGMLLSFGKNIFYIFNFLLGTIILFQFPLILEILMVMKVVKRRTLIRSSRFVIIGVFLLAALLTPPDFISQVSLALPMMLLYGLTLLIAKLFRFGEG